MANVVSITNYAQTILAETSLLYYWRFDDLAAPFVDSKASKHFAATGTGIRYNQPGLLSGDYDGAVNNIDVTGNSYIAATGLSIPTTSFTVEFLLNLWTTGNLDLFQLYNGSVTITAQIRSGILTITYVQSSLSVSCPLTPTVNEPPYSDSSTWAIALVNDGALLKLYVDGVLQSWVAAVMPGGTLNDLTFGGGSITSTQFTLDELAIYNAPIGTDLIAHMAISRYVPLQQLIVNPFPREGCSVRGVQVDVLGGNGIPFTSTGYRLGTTQLLAIDQGEQNNFIAGTTSNFAFTDITAPINSTVVATLYAQDTVTVIKTLTLTADTVGSTLYSGSTTTSGLPSSEDVPYTFSIIATTGVGTVTIYAAGSVYGYLVGGSWAVPAQYPTVASPVYQFSIFNLSAPINATVTAKLYKPDSTLAATMLMTQTATNSGIYNGTIYVGGTLPDSTNIPYTFGVVAVDGFGTTIVWPSDTVYGYLFAGNWSSQNNYPTPGIEAFRAAARDSNGCWTEWGPAFTVGTIGWTKGYGAGAVNGSIGSGALSDLTIGSPGSVFPDLAQGSSKMFVRRTLVTDGFLDETQTAGWPKGRAAFMVKFDLLDDNDRMLLHRFFRATNGATQPFFFDYVEPQDGTRTTGVSRRYLVRFRDPKISDSMFGEPGLTEMQFTLVELSDCPSGGDTYSQTPQDLLYTEAVNPPNFIDTEFQFEPRTGLENSVRWALPAGAPTGGIVVGYDPFAAAVVELAPKAYFRLNETSGPTAFDSIGANNGTYYTVGAGVSLNESAAVPGDLSALFGAGGHVSGAAGIMGYYASRSTLSLSCWFRHFGQSAYATICGWNAYKEFDLSIDLTYPALRATFFDSALVNHSVTGPIGNTYSDGNWHFAVMVMDGPNNQLALYVDGVIVGSAGLPTSTTVYANNTDPFTIAAENNSSLAPFAGLISQVAIFPQALTEAQVVALYTASGNGAVAYGKPAPLRCASGGPSIVLYGKNANRMNQRVRIECAVTGSPNASVQVGAILRYKDASNYVIAYATGVNGGGQAFFVVAEIISGAGTNLIFAPINLAINNAFQAEVIGQRIRWWWDGYPELQERPPNGAFDLNGSYDDTYNQWGVFMQQPGWQLTRFMACELPGAIMPPPMLTVNSATDYQFIPVPLVLATTYITDGKEIEWEVLTNDPADIPEPYRVTTAGASLSQTVYIRDGYSYLARARVVQTPWSEYVPIQVGVASGSGWSSRSQLTTNWPSQDYATDGETTPIATQYNFPPILPDYVLEGSDEVMVKVSTSNVGKDSTSTNQRRPRRTFTLKFDSRTSKEYQVLIDFFEFCQAKTTPFNWTHPITGEQFVLRFNADDYDRTDKDQDSDYQVQSGIVDISFPCIEVPPTGSVVPTLAFSLNLDPGILA